MTAVCKGIDVSPTYQPSIDWAKVAGAGYRFAFLKATEGAAWPALDTADGRWLGPNAGAAAAHGLAVGAYHFAQPAGASPQAQAAFFLERIKPVAEHLTLPDALDFEVSAGCSPAELRGWVLDFLHYLEHAGRSVMFYTYPAFITEDLDGWRPGCKLWLADPDNTDAHALRTITQHAQVMVPGIAGEKTDTNSTLVDLAQLVEQHRTPTTPHPAPAKPEHTPAPLPILDLRRATDAHLVTGPGVSSLQALLRNAGYHGVRVDGHAGAITRSAVIHFQRARPTADPAGLVGGATWRELVRA